MKKNYKSSLLYSDETAPFMSFKSAFTYSDPVPYSWHQETTKDGFKKEAYNVKVVRLFITYFSYFTIIALLPITFWICVKRIHALERLVVLRLGKLRPLVGPGYCIVIPFVDKWTVVDLQPKTFNIDNEKLLTADRAIVEISVSMKYSISKTVQYATRLHNQEEAFGNFARYSILNAMSELQQSVLEMERENVAVSIKTKLNKTAIQWGLEVLNVEIPVVKVLQESDQQHGPEVLLNALKAVSSGWQHPLAQSAAVGIPQLLKKNDSNLLPTLMETQSDLGNNSFIDDLTAWLEGEGYDQGITLLAESFELKISRKGNILYVMYVYMQDGKVCVSKDHQTYYTSCIVTIEEEDAKDLINNKISPQQAFIQGKIQLQ